MLTAYKVESVPDTCNIFLCIVHLILSLVSNVGLALFIYTFLLCYSKCDLHDLHSQFC